MLFSIFLSLWHDRLCIGGGLKMSISFNSLGALRSFSREGRTVMLDYGGPGVAITVLTDRLVRVRLAPEGAFEVRRSWAVARVDEEFSEVTYELEDSDRELTLKTSALSVKIDRESGGLAFVDVQGQRFCADE